MKLEEDLPKAHVFFHHFRLRVVEYHQDVGPVLLNVLVVLIQTSKLQAQTSKLQAQTSKLRAPRMTQQMKVCKLHKYKLFHVLIFVMAKSG